MTKTRFTAADVRAMVRDLRATVHGLRVVNVYDLDAKVITAVQYSVVENHSKVDRSDCCTERRSRHCLTERMIHMFAQAVRSSLQYVAQAGR